MYNLDRFGMVGLSRFCCPDDEIDPADEIDAIKRDLMEDDERRLIFIGEYTQKNLHRHINIGFNATERLIAVQLHWSVKCRKEARKKVLGSL